MRIRSKDAAGMMSLFNERMAECTARGVPGTVTRDEDMASPARARVRFEATAAAAHAMVDGVAAVVPRLPEVNEDAETTVAANVERGEGAVAAPVPAAATTDGALPTAELARLLQLGATATETVAPGLPPALPTTALPLYIPMMVMHNQLGVPAPGMPSTMQPGMGMLGGNPMLMPTAPGMMPPAPGMVMPPVPGMMPTGPPGFDPGSMGTPMEQAMLLHMADMNRQRYGGTRDEDVLIESFNMRGANRITVPMALAMRSSIPGEVSGERAVCDVKLRDTMMPGGIARKVEMVAASSSIRQGILPW